MGVTVSKLARAARVSIRTLHHYDQIGLLVPSERSEAGYRLYGDAELVRLQQILFYRALGLELAEIRRILKDPKAQVREVLARQRDVLAEQRRRLDAMIAAIESTIDNLNAGATMKPETMFDAFNHETYANEAQQRWGETPAWKESARRTARYTPQDWARLKQEGHEIYVRLAGLLAQGRPPDDPEVQAAIEAHRAHIERWFYPCSRELHASLGQGYVDDARFTANIDRYGAGLSAFMAEATRIAARG